MDSDDLSLTIIACTLLVCATVVLVVAMFKGYTYRRGGKS